MAVQRDAVFSDFKWDRSTEKFQYDPVVRERLRNRYDLEDKLVIGHVGRFCEEKNHKKILEIAKELQKASEDKTGVCRGTDR